MAKCKMLWGKIRDWLAVPGKCFRRIFVKWKKIRKEAEEKEELFQKEPWENTFLEYSRQVIEQILRQKALDYRSFRPVLIDTDLPDQHFGEEDDVDQVLFQMEKGLNFLEICTDRPEHFENWKAHMEDEYGLIVRLVPKNREEPLYGNMVLDFERNSPMHMENFSKEVIYLPFQKRRWEILHPEEKEPVPVTGHERETGGKMSPETAENKEKPEQDYLDINVPIGYNMLAVMVKKND